MEASLGLRHAFLPLIHEHSLGRGRAGEQERVTKPQESLRGRLNVHLTVFPRVWFLNSCGSAGCGYPTSQFSLHNFRPTAFVHPMTRQE